MAISLMLINLFVTLRREIPFHWMALAFGVFIIACGFTHFLEVVTLWSPIYWFPGGVKAITAAASVTTAVVMPRVLPRAPQLVTAARLSTERQTALERVNADLLRALDEQRRNELERRRLNQGLARSNAELEQFSSVASHDLRSPLNTIGGYAQLLRMRYTGKLDGEDGEFLTFIMEAVKRMQGLIDDLLTYARLGWEATDPQPVDCAELVRRVVAELHDAITASDAVVSYDGRPTVLGQPTQLGRVFQNLIANAITFHAEAPPQVTVSALRQDTG